MKFSSEKLDHQHQRQSYLKEMNHFCLHVLEISMPSIMLSFLYTITGISYIFHAVLHTTTNEVLTMLYYDFIDLIVFVGIQ